MAIDRGTNTFDEVVGLLKRATIVKYLPNEDRMLVKLANGQAIAGQNPLVPIKVQAPHSMFYNNGLFIGTLPAEGTPVIIGQGSGGQFHFVSFISEDLPNVPTIKLGELLVQSNDTTFLKLNSNKDIYLGSDVNSIHINTQNNLITTNFNNENHFTQGARRVEGIVKRDRTRKTKISQNLKLDSDIYDQKFDPIGMDPTSTTNNLITGASKNPPFVENREIIYEFQYLSDIRDDLRESVRYGTEKQTPLDFSFPSRRQSRADTLSLSLVSPNFLIETVKGTVVDIFGNILDLNRYAIPIGQEQNTINKTQSKDKEQSFILIKELERKSLAYHFEINARKNLSTANGLSLPDVTSNADYSRGRSRFFIDIDKEGQFKINVPASSEKGNVPLLTRYENYSTFGPEDNGNPDKLIYGGAGNNFDIYQDSFASPAFTAVGAGFLPATDGSRGSITLQTTDGANAAPQDRLTGQHIKHGIAYHDILQTCFVHQNNTFLNYQTGEVSPLTVDLSTIPQLNNIVSDTIIVSGDKAKAGGRSGQINFDGSVEINIGANTIDRQSVWYDTAGGIVANIGRDINGRSIMAATGGDFFLQVGGFGIAGDSRFQPPDFNNGIKGGVLDLRILTDGGYCHMIRCDNNGITILSPQRFSLHSKGELTITSDTSIKIQSPRVDIQERTVLQNFVSV